MDLLDWLDLPNGHRIRAVTSNTAASATGAAATAPSKTAANSSASPASSPKGEVNASPSGRAVPPTSSTTTTRTTTSPLKSATPASPPPKSTTTHPPPPPPPSSKSPSTPPPDPTSKPPPPTSKAPVPPPSASKPTAPSLASPKPPVDNSSKPPAVISSTKPPPTPVNSPNPSANHTSSSSSASKSIATSSGPLPPLVGATNSSQTIQTSTSSADLIVSSSANSTSTPPQTSVVAADTAGGHSSWIHNRETSALVFTFGAILILLLIGTGIFCWFWWRGRPRSSRTDGGTASDMQEFAGFRRTASLASRSTGAPRASSYRSSNAPSSENGYARFEPSTSKRVQENAGFHRPFIRPVFAGNLSANSVHHVIYPDILPTLPPGRPASPDSVYDDEPYTAYDSPSLPAPRPAYIIDRRPVPRFE